MRNIELENYHILFTVLLLITIFFIIVLIILFIVFDITKIISVKTGFALKKSIKRLNAINQHEDNISRKKYKGHYIQLKNEKEQESMVQRDGRGDETERINISVKKDSVKLKEKSVIIFDEPKQRNRIENEENYKEEISKKEFFKITETKEVKSVEVVAVNNPAAGNGASSL